MVIYNKNLYSIQYKIQI